MKHRGWRANEARRLWLAAGVGLPAWAWTGALHAQADSRAAPVVVGWLANGHRDGRALVNAFTEGMAALGWKLGVHYALEERHADGQVERLPALAVELAALKPAAIVAWPSAAARAATAAAPTTPVVLLNGDALASGLVKSLARPGGMLTGTSNMSSDTVQKVIELLVELMPKLQRVGFLADATSASAQGVALSKIRRTAEQLRIEPVIARLAGPQDIEPSFKRLAKAKVQAVVVLPSAWFTAHIPAIIQPALAQRWPVVGTIATIPRRGGLFNYGADGMALARRSAHYVDRILKGAKPGDLPVEQPTVFEFILNLKTAKALGITTPASTRLRATEVIE
jgi:putative tryptophan/tyrosine transport system substrate-binding protein